LPPQIEAEQQTAFEPSLHEGDAAHGLLRPPQYGLKTLFWAVTLVAVLLSIMVSVGYVWAMAIGMAVLLVGSHVVGNALGKRLRDGATRSRQDRAPRPDLQERRKTAWQPPRASRLSHHHPTGRTVYIVSAFGASLSAVAGASLAAWHYGSRISLPAIAVAGIAAAVLGALLSFFVTLGLGTISEAWRDMWREHKQRL